VPLVLEQRIYQILGKSPMKRKSKRVCKKCYRRLESSHKRIRVLQQDKDQLIVNYESNKANNIEAARSVQTAIASKQHDVEFRSVTFQSNMQNTLKHDYSDVQETVKVKVNTKSDSVGYDTYNFRSKLVFKPVSFVHDRGRRRYKESVLSRQRSLSSTRSQGSERPLPAGN